MAPARASSSLGALIVLSAPAAAQESNDKIDRLKAAIAEGCRPDPRGGGSIAAKDLRKALSGAYAIVWDWDGDAPPDNKAMVRQIEQAGLDPGSMQGKPNQEALVAIGVYTERWTRNDPSGLSLEQGGVVVRNADGGAASAQDFLPVLRTIFLGEAPERYRFVCGKPKPEEPGPGAGKLVVPPPTLTIAKAADQLGKGGADQKAGEIGLIDDRVKDNVSFATNLAAGLAIPIFRPTRKDEIRPVSLDDANLIPFISYNRQGSRDPAEKSYVNNLSFGVATNGFLVFRDPGAEGHGTFRTWYSLSARYETDDRLHSDAWFIAAQVQPFLPIPGNSTPWFPVSGKSFELGFVWSAAGAFDHSSVSDPWKKQALLDTRHFTRLGGDLTGAFIVRPSWGNGDWSLRLESSQYHRWNLAAAEGSAHLYSTRLTFAPMDDYSISLGYDRGNELDSLAAIHQWKVTVGIKR